MAPIKGLPKFSERLDGSPLRIAIVHARWNAPVIDALVAGAITKLRDNGVKESNIVVQSVPGSFELPLACQRCVYMFSVSSFPSLFLVSSLVRMFRQGRLQPTCSVECLLLPWATPVLVLLHRAAREQPTSRSTQFERQASSS